MLYVFLGSRNRTFIVVVVFGREMLNEVTGSEICTAEVGGLVTSWFIVASNTTQ